MILSEIDKLKYAKHQIRLVLEEKGTGITKSSLFNTYPSYILAMGAMPSGENPGLLDYCEDGTSTFTVNTSVIRDYAFYNYTTLKNLVIDNTEFVPLNGPNAFVGTLIEQGLGYIYVPQDLLDTYKNADNWSVYSDYIISGTPETETQKVIVEHLESANRSVEWIETLTLEKLQGQEF